MVILVIQYFSSSLVAQQQAALLFESATQQGVQEAFYKNNITKTANYFIVHFGNNQNTPGQFNDQLKWCTYIAPAPTIVFMPNSFQQHGDVTTHFENYNFLSPGSIYVAGLMNHPIDSNDLEFELVPNGWHQPAAGGDLEDSFIMKWRMENNSALLVRSTLFGADGHDEITAIDTDANGNLYITGFSQINAIANQSEWCEAPTDQSFPMCDHNGQLYTETDIYNNGSRAFVAAFNAGGQMYWSTQYGSGTGNAARGICTNQTKVWIVGSSNKDWTFVDYNENSEDDYYRELNPLSDDLPEGTIARFDIPQIVDLQDLSFQNPQNINVYPNPNNGRLTIDLRYAGYNGPLELSVINSLGQIIKAEQHSSSKGFIDCEMYDLSPGVYHLVLIGDGIIEATSFVKN